MGFFLLLHGIIIIIHKGSPRILVWVAYPFSSRSSHPRNRTEVSPALQADSLPTELSGKPLITGSNGYALVVVCWLLIAVTSLVAEHGLQGVWASEVSVPRL